MPTVTLNKTVLEKLVGKKLPLEQLKDRISMLGTDLEGIEGDEITVEIFPNRPDLLSEQGFARAFASFIGVKTGFRNYTVKKSSHKVIVNPNTTMRPYTACAIVKNLKLSDERIREIMQIQEKLATTHGRQRKKSAYGIYPLDNINFPLRYIAKDPKEVMFHPLGFDKKIKASKVEEEHPAGKKYAHIAQGWKHYPFFIDNKENVMCMLPYTNSHDTGKVEINTKDIFIECTGNDLENVSVALNIFVTMFADMGGDIYSLDIEYKDKTITTPDLTPKKMKIDYNYINKILGLDKKESEIDALLQRMGFGTEKGQALIPAYRNDIIHQADLMEDVAIAYGYENFDAIIPNVSTIGEESRAERFQKTVREWAVGHGLLEVKNYHLITEEIDGSKIRQESITIPIPNAVGEHNVLRSSLFGSLMKTMENNAHHEYPQKIVEIGRIFKKDKNTETGISEQERLGIVICDDKADVTYAKQLVIDLAESVGCEVEVKEADDPSCIPGRCAEIILKRKQSRKSNSKQNKTKENKSQKTHEQIIGIIGEVHPEVLENFHIEMPAIMIELNLDALEEQAYQ